MNKAKHKYSKRYKYPKPETTSRMYSKDKSWFRIALEMSKMSTYNGTHIGCIAVMGHRIVSSGYNTCKTEPLQKRANRMRFTDDGYGNCVHSSHAEIKCLKPLLQAHGSNLSRVKLYVVRRRRNGTIGLARPCAACMKIIKDAGIKHVYYSGDSEFLKENVFTGEVCKLSC